MSLARSVLLALAAVALGGMPATAHAQSGVTVCRDGSRMSGTASSLCNGHGGVDATRTMAARRGLGDNGATQTAQRSSSTRTGIARFPLPTGTRAERPVHRTDGDDRAERRRDREDHDEDDDRDRDPDHGRGHGRGRGRGRSDDDRNAPRSASARCVDGSYAHGKGNPKNVCKHNGGVARWLDRGR